MTERLIIIGGVAAGMSAASKARRNDQNISITVYERSGYVSYGACGFPYHIKGDIPNLMDVVIRTPQDFRKQNILAHVRHDVLEIDPQAQTVRIEDRETGREFTDSWDKLILTTGNEPARPPIPGLDQAGIFTLRNVEDTRNITRWLDAEEGDPVHGVIIGGGFIGLEMAEALAARGVKLTMIEMLPQVMPNMDADMASHIAAELTRQGVDLRLGYRVEAFEGEGRVQAVIANGERFPADVVIFSVGARPNIVLAKQIGVELGPTGAIAVNDRQGTNRPNVWAAGDVSEARHVVTGKPAYVPLGSTANKQGRVAGDNAAGGNATFGGIAGAAVVKVFDLHAARTGLSEKQARDEGFDVETVSVKSASKAHYMPGHCPIYVKLIFEKGSQRLLGGQLVGREGVSKRIDVITAGLYAGWTTYDLGQLDLSYAPPFAPVWDPILVATNVANRG
jgi:NADPH-dependent 2,4-dienoyl-CoA reductase/sulfur reductase-like enzyme